MKPGLKKTLVGIAVTASGAAGVVVATAITGQAATASVQTHTPAVAPAAVAPAAAPQQFEGGYGMYGMATSTVNCPDMGPNSTTPTSTVAPSAGT